MQDLRIAGAFAADEPADGFASAAACTKYDPGAECNTIVRYRVEMANVAARRTLKVPVSGPVSSLALSPAGAAAWVVTTPPASPALKLPELGTQCNRREFCGVTARSADTSW